LQSGKKGNSLWAITPIDECKILWNQVKGSKVRQEAGKERLTKKKGRKIWRNRKRLAFSEVKLGGVN
jgi:hypothetical protein